MGTGQGYSKLVIVTWILCLFGGSVSDIYTSSQKITDMVVQEEQFLYDLLSEVSNTGNSSALSLFESFYANRLHEVEKRQMNKNLREEMKHPNAIYRHIVEFASSYQGIRSVLDSTNSPSIQQKLSTVASIKDVMGAKRAILRLQDTYSLEPAQMVRGDYLGYIGPSLTPEEAFEIGQFAFHVGRLNTSMSWLKEALALKDELSPGSKEAEETTFQEVQVIALQGRMYNIVRHGSKCEKISFSEAMGHEDEAMRLYETARSIDPTHTEVELLRVELDSRARLYGGGESMGAVNYNQLCSAQNKMTPENGTFDLRLGCTYKVAKLPYYRFKKELISISPYVCLFYDVTSDSESQNIIAFTRDKLERGKVATADGSVHNEGRISDLSFIKDHEFELVARTSQRVSYLTDLDTTQQSDGIIFSGEALQVLNYGMGGHYVTHMDTFEEPWTKVVGDMMHSGNRLATFLIYLSEVERGGATIFTKVDIAVRPVKNAALFWYNIKPSGEVDQDTHHAGCPVAVGHKWASNKWIWTYGNTFTRRCGLMQNATQLDIEDDMERGWV